MSKKRAVFTGTAVVLVALALGVGYRLLTRGEPSEQLVIVTWNVRGYPEKEADRREWFSEELEAREHRVRVCPHCGKGLDPEGAPK